MEAPVTDTAQIELDQVVLRQITFKPGAMREAAITVIETLMSDRGCKSFADKCDFSVIMADDRNCIGGAFQQLKRVGLIAPTGRFRRSQAKASRGRTVFEWEIVNYRLAETFLARNEQPVTQPELAL